MNAPPMQRRRRRESMRIAGKLVDDRRRRRGAAIPMTTRSSARCRRRAPEHVRDAFAKAKAFKPKLTRYERQQILQKTAEMLRDRKEEFARLITAESGLCWKDSLYEASRAYDVWSFAAQLTIKDDGEIFACDISPNGKQRKIFTTRTPLLGVISAITPFNHPLNMVSHKLAPAIATNNRVVLKPTELTPLTALALADVLYEAGLPPEMLSVVTGNPSTMGDAMITDPGRRPRHLHGLGARRQAHRATAGYKRIVLELGGNDPLIVMEDADLDKAAELAVAGRDQEFRPALHGGEAHPGASRASPTSSPSSCSRRRRSSNAATRWIRRPMSARSSTSARPSCSRAASTTR